MTANGQVFLVNPSGVLFGRTAQVDVGGLVATSLNISDSNFLAGRYTFASSGAAGPVINEGTLRATDGGYIALLAPEVRNQARDRCAPRNGGARRRKQGDARLLG